MSNSITIKECGGFLFIGDPHVTTNPPGRRKDDYLSSVLSKLAQAAQIANSLNLQAVITGDLMHVAFDNSLRMLNRLISTLKLFKRTPLTLGGNHDKDQFKLSEEDALCLLQNAGAVKVFDEEGEMGVFDIDGTPVRLWACPDYCDIPKKLPHFDGISIMVSHHNMAFERSYPTSIPLTEIANCDMVVNGHMHDTKRPQTIGSTLWCNPGNIEPLSVDLRFHVPSVWQWAPATRELGLIQHKLEHGTDLFNMEGLQVSAASSGEGVTAVVSEDAPIKSKFVELTLAQEGTDISTTYDASVLKTDLDAILEDPAIQPETATLLNFLFTQLQESTLST